jgi:hypothetical protein
MEGEYCQQRAAVERFHATNQKVRIHPTANKRTTFDNFSRATTAPFFEQQPFHHHDKSKKINKTMSVLLLTGFR